MTSSARVLPVRCCSRTRSRQVVVVQVVTTGSRRSRGSTRPAGRSRRPASSIAVSEQLRQAVDAVDQHLAFPRQVVEPDVLQLHALRAPRRRASANRRWKPIATLHSPIARCPSSRSACVTSPVGLVKSTNHAPGAPRRAVSCASSSTTGTVRSAFANPPAPVVSCPMLPNRSGIVSSEPRGLVRPPAAARSRSRRPRSLRPRSAVSVSPPTSRHGASSAPRAHPRPTRRSGSMSSSTSSSTGNRSSPRDEPLDELRRVGAPTADDRHLHTHAAGIVHSRPMKSLGNFPDPFIAEISGNPTRSGGRPPASPISATVLDGLAALARRTDPRVHRHGQLLRRVLSRGDRLAAAGVAGPACRHVGAAALPHRHAAGRRRVLVTVSQSGESAEVVRLTRVCAATPSAARRRRHERRRTNSARASWPTAARHPSRRRGRPVDHDVRRIARRRRAPSRACSRGKRPSLRSTRTRRGAEARPRLDRGAPRTADAPRRARGVARRPPHVRDPRAADPRVPRRRWARSR